MLPASLVLQIVKPAQEERTLQGLERGWHNDVIDFVQYDLPRIAVLLLIAFVLQRTVLFFVNRMIRLADKQVGNSQRGAQLRTMAAILRATAYAVIGFIVLLQILLVFGVRIEPLLASAGVLGVGIGLGAQSIFKDMINGILILIEDQYNVGEVIKIASLTGTVEDMSLRRTNLRDGDGTLYVIPNSQITTVANLSRDFSVATINLGVDASADPDKVLSLLRKIAAEVRHDAAFKQVVMGDPDVPGLDAIKGREVLYPITIKCLANQQWGVLRELRIRIIKAFRENGLPLGIDPASMFVMKQPDPTAPPAQQPLVG